MKQNNQNINNNIPKFFKISKLLYEHKIKILISILLSIFASILMIIAPKIIASLINLVFYTMPNSPEENAYIKYENILYLICILMIIYLLIYIFQTGQSLICTKISKKITSDIRIWIIKQIYKTPLYNLYKLNNGEIIVQMINDSEVVGQNLAEIFSSIFNSIILIVCSFIMMLTISTSITLIIIFIAFICAILPNFTFKYLKKHILAKQHCLANMNLYTEENITAKDIIKIYNTYLKSNKQFMKNNDEIYYHDYKISLINNITTPFISILQNLSYIMIIIIGAFQMLNGIITLGDIQALIQYSNYFSNPLNTLIDNYKSIQRVSVSYDRISKIANNNMIFDTSSNLYVGHKFLNEKQDINTFNTLDFKNIHFSYDNKTKIIDNLSFSINRGETVAIVGPTGAGKTTIINLMMGYLRSNKGNIIINNKNINDYPEEYLKQYFAVVPQDPWLFYESIMYNLRYGNQNISEQEAIEACKLLDINKIIQKLPNQYNTILDEHNKLSLGQQQLLCIVRAIASKRQILILDEATKYMDTDAHTKFDKNIKKLNKNITILVIAHKLSTIKNADNILVIDKGRLIEQGTHANLISKKGLYYTLYTSGTFN